jgi:uncharacterized RDD family membrane protein YckC
MNEPFQPEDARFAPPDLPPVPAYNPYAPPEAMLADVDLDLDEMPLADRGARLRARILDSFILGIPLIAFAMAIPSAEEWTPTQGTVAVLMTLALLALGVLQVVYFVRDGQTIGKKAVKIRIVRTDGSRASGGRLVGARVLVPGLLGAVPVVGVFFGFVNILFIFRQDQRCLHDHIADTKVVVAQESS